MVVLNIDVGRTLFLLSIAGGAAAAVSEDGVCGTDWFSLGDNKHHNPRMAEGFPIDLWRKKELKVLFMNPDGMPRYWKNSRQDSITREEILQIANEWHDCAQKVVPKFVECDEEEGSDIRVEYNKGI